MTTAFASLAVDAGLARGGSRESGMGVEGRRVAESWSSYFITSFRNSSSTGSLGMTGGVQFSGTSNFFAETCGGARAHST